MDQAQGAIDAARAAGADRYATEQYEAAVKALQERAGRRRAARLSAGAELRARQPRPRATGGEGSGHPAGACCAARPSGRLGEVTASLDQAEQQLKAAEAARVPRRVARRRAHRDRRRGSVSAKSGHEHSGRQLHGEPGTACGICRETAVGDGRNRDGHEGARQVTAVTEDLQNLLVSCSRTATSALRRPASPTPSDTTRHRATRRAGCRPARSLRRRATRRRTRPPPPRRRTRRCPRPASARLRAPRSGCARDRALRLLRTRHSCGRGISDGVRWRAPACGVATRASGSSSSTH